MNQTNEHIDIELGGPVARVWLDRPEIHNALNNALIREVVDAVESLGREESVRVIVLGGRGESFCSGADMAWMKGMVGHHRKGHLRESALLQSLYRTLDECPRPVIGRIHGPALGGGTGLASVCDIAVAVPEAVFGAVEVKFWLLPAVIAPYIVQKVGPSHARSFFLTGERFSADRAADMGLVHHVVPAGDLDAFIEKKISSLLTTGPQTLAATKSLIPRIAGRKPGDVLDLTLEAVDELLATPEGRKELTDHVIRRVPSFNPFQG